MSLVRIVLCSRHTVSVTHYYRCTLENMTSSDHDDDMKMGAVAHPDVGMLTLGGLRPPVQESGCSDRVHLKKKKRISHV